MFVVFNVKLLEEIFILVIMLYEMGMGVVILGIYMVFSGKIIFFMFDMCWEDLGWLLFLGIVCMFFVFLVMLDVVKKFGVFMVLFFINLELVYIILLVILILYEDKMLSGNFYIGVVLIIVIVVMNVVYKSYVVVRNWVLMKEF